VYLEGLKRLYDWSRRLIELALLSRDLKKVFALQSYLQLFLLSEMLRCLILEEVENNLLRSLSVIKKEKKRRRGSDDCDIVESGHMDM
jgi:hypothetical protein